EVIECFSLSTQEILEGMRKSASLDPSDLSGVLSEQAASRLSRLSLQFEVEMEGAEKATEEFASCVRELFRMHARERLDTIAKEIKKAEDEKDEEGLAHLVSEFQVLSRKLHF
ncbi:MAG: hypothetical protein U1C72_01945, partial [Candidatus Pacearchaeota archaeon]|nr:hypothetical protein [Candidatus Pacearchaeota archaeon]